MVETTGGYTSAELTAQAKSLELTELTQEVAIAIGEHAVEIARQRKHPIAIEVRIDGWTVFHVSLPGSNAENDWWIGRKARVVALTGNSSIYERVKAEEDGVDWYASRGLEEELYAIHGGGFPLVVKGKGMAGAFFVSGLPQVDDHKLIVEVLEKFANK